MDPIIILAKFEVRSFTRSTVPGIIAIGILGRGCEPQSWGRGGRRGSGMVPLETALVTSYRPSVVTFPISLTRFRDIACRFCAPARHFFPPHL